MEYLQVLDKKILNKKVEYKSPEEKYFMIAFIFIENSE